jgi:hypothetical protein
MVWISFFFANQTIIFFRIVFCGIGEQEGMWVMLILSFEWERCTVKTQGKIAIIAYKYATAPVLQPITKHCTFQQKL